MSGPQISLVIPAYNEERYLPRLLDSVDAARAGFGAPSAVEVIVADNDSTDRTAALAAARGCRVVAVQRRCIAAARNGGARLAVGELLAFVDADSRIHPATFEAIAGLLQRGDVVGGATGVTLERWSLGLALTYAMIVPMVWLTGMDTGVVFCRRADFDTVGGYDQSLRLAEDVAFLLALRRLGRARGQRLVRARWAKAVASTRKFDQYGDWHYFSLLLRAPILLLRRRRFDRLADHYWYQPDR
jgi:glycosyltransferase involved in cell wall biosynthesis